MWIDRQDLLYTIRSARREPVLCIVAVLALSVGIGLNAGVFTLLNAMFLSAPTQTNPASFVQIYPRYEGWFAGAAQFSSFTTEDYDAIRTRSTALEEAAASQQSSAILDQGHRRISTLLVTCNYFHVFGIYRPLLGRLLASNECDRGIASAQVVVLSEPFWRSQFNADAHIVGGIVHLNGLPFTVLGVVPADDANFLAAGVFIPYTLQPILDRSTNLLESPDSPWLGVTARLRQGHSRADAQAELATILRRQDRVYVERKISRLNRKTSVVLTNGSFVQDPAIGDLALALIALILGPLLLVLLLACSNVTMLFLSRAVVRRGEIAVRLALGIGRARLIRMLLMESVLTVLIAAPISVAVAYRVPLLIMNVADPNQSRSVPLIHPNWHVFGYLAALIVVATVASSLAPMHAVWKLDLTTTLKGREGSTTASSRTTSGLMIAQIAMSFVLLAAAVLFGRLPGLVTAMDPGFETRHTLAVPLEFDTSSENRTAALSFYRTLESRIRSIPGVQSLAYESLQPFRGSAPSEIRLPGQKEGQGKPASVDEVSTDFFSTFGIRVIAGRSFLTSDETSASAGSVVVVSQAFAKQFWPNEDPIGKVITTPDNKRSAVVGLVVDTRSERFGITDGPRLYTLRDPAELDGQMYVRFTGNTKTMETAVRDAVRSLDPTQIEAPQTIWELLEAQAEQMRSLALIVVVMASIAVLLALTGVYGVLSFVINQRRREFGIRMALGANRPSIFCLILLRGCRQIALGLVCGIALAEPAAWSFTRLLKNSPLPLRNFDALVYGIASGLLVAVSLSAMYLPAMRATQVDSMKALRTD